MREMKRKGKENAFFCFDLFLFFLVVPFYEDENSENARDEERKEREKGRGQGSVDEGLIDEVG